MLTKLTGSTKTDRGQTSGFAGYTLKWTVDIPQGGKIGPL